MNQTRAADISNQQIAEAITRHRKARYPRRGFDYFHEHPDCVRIACAWLSAQRRTQAAKQVYHPIKHMVEQWAARYVSADDVQAAAYLLGIEGTYPNFRLSHAMVVPDPGRLDGIREAFTQPMYFAGTHGRRAFIEENNATHGTRLEPPYTRVEVGTVEDVAREIARRIAEKKARREFSTPAATNKAGEIRP